MNRSTFGALAVVLFMVLYFTVGKGADSDILKKKQTAKDTGTEMKDGDIRWTFKETKESDGMNPPKTVVTLWVKSKQYDAGIHDGSCAERETQLFPDEVSPYAVCWWAGGGTELGVFKEGDKFILKQGIVEEGGEDYPAYRGQFKVVKGLEY